MKNHKKQRLLYILFDFLAAAAAWILFFLFRKTQIEPQVFGSQVPIALDSTFWAGVTGIPVAWITFYYFTGFYNNIFHRSRLDDFVRTLMSSLLVLAFWLLLSTRLVSNVALNRSWSVETCIHAVDASSCAHPALQHV